MLVLGGIVCAKSKMENCAVILCPYILMKTTILTHTDMFKFA